MKNVSDIHVPDQMVRNTGEGMPIQEVLDKFFMDVLEFLELSDFSKQMKVETDYREVTTGINKVLANDGVITLVVCDVLVASVITRRNDRNYDEVSFAHYLSEATLKHVKEVDDRNRVHAMDITVEEIGLSNRTSNCLCTAGILKLSQLVSRDENELMAIRGFGKFCLGEVREALKSKNLSLYRYE